jgi:eukaryotic-like serine/threonine-protein kinase
MLIPIEPMMSQIERFGKYILLEKLASGGMAEIYLAKSLGAQGINKFLAIKRILPQFNESAEFKEMFREEAKLSVNLRHSNVVPIFDFGEEQNQFYIAMDYVEGRNMRQILNELKKQQLQLSVEQICYIVREAAAGLDHAHRCLDGSTGKPLNIIHRDISPQNIMISYDGEVKIIDFGIAKAETQLEATKAGTLKGKFGYMSPEQADGQNIDARTDIFSLGIVFWELLANDRLFTASSEAAILRKIRDCQVPQIRKINPNVHPELEKIVAKVLARDPHVRYQSASALHKDLNRFLNTQYPDFNAQDFAVFIKNTFTVDYQESKKKLVDYAKVQSVELEAQHKSKNTSTTPPKPPAFESTIIDHQLEKLENLNINSESSKKVDLLKTKKEGFTKASIDLGQTQSQIHRTKTKTQIPIRSSYNDLDYVGYATKFAIVALVISAAWWGYQNGVVSDLLKTTTAQHKKITLSKSESAAVAGTSEVASTAIYQVTISSVPSGAKIYFDGIDQQSFTPKVFNLQAQKAVHVTLKKEDHYFYEIDFTPIKDAQSLNARLLPTNRQAAFVLVNVINGGFSPVIEINGQKVGDKPPFTDLYPVPAQSPVTIRARNEFTGAMAETTVNLNPEARKNVELILGLRP